MLVKWQPFGSLLNNHDIFGDFLDTTFPVRARDFAPEIEVRETENSFVIEAELPGLAKEDFKLTVENNTLTLEGEKKLAKDEKEEGYYRSERKYGSFRRSFRLTDEVDSKKIKADFKNGVLSVEIPKVEKAKPKQIEVKKSLKKMTYDPSKAIKSAISKIEKETPKERPHTVKEAIDKLKDDVEGTENAVMQSRAGQGVGKKTLDLLDIYNAEIWQRIQKNWAFSSDLFLNRDSFLYFISNWAFCFSIAFTFASAIDISLSSVLVFVLVKFLSLSSAWILN